MSVKRLQIMIEEELDAALARQAAEEGVSKAALIRRYVGERLRPLPPINEDPLWELVGMAGDDVEPVDDIDEVIYGGHERDRP
jgi:Ribbon-helix-helix protein, copG family